MKSAATVITGVQTPAGVWGVTRIRSFPFPVFLEPRESLAPPSSSHIFVHTPGLQRTPDVADRIYGPFQDHLNGPRSGLRNHVLHLFDLLQPVDVAVQAFEGPTIFTADTC
jgi:hypothetical protein